ncbi:MAG: hypothetical protein H7A09_10025 [Oceanospirillaceae bacterium]|nr:hypothetical protein [Oceanospirillaceae bacterium]MCP5335124.1 hypothetical protein [Oceanospirillaceae bacterium]
MYAHRLILLFVFAIFVFSPVIMDWWLAPGGAWYRPYAVWLILIAVSIWLERWQEDDEL